MLLVGVWCSYGLYSEAGQPCLRQVGFGILLTATVGQKAIIIARRICYLATLPSIDSNSERRSAFDFASSTQELVFSAAIDACDFCPKPQKRPLRVVCCLRYYKMSTPEGRRALGAWPRIPLKTR